MKIITIAFTGLLLLIGATMGEAHATPASPARSVASFTDSLKQKARMQGISDALLQDVFADFTINKSAIASDKKQPEDKLRFTKYKNNIVSAERVRRGRALYRQHHALLQEISAHYGVPAHYIVALWGTETSFGSFTGGYNVPHALASLAYEGRREAFFTEEFITALKIIEAGHISYAQMKGSWAGAMGQCQFMPSSFLKFAVDYNKDGKVDIWNSLPDIFASIANYLSQSGWKQDEKWGRKISLPAGFDYTQENINGFFPLSHWQKKGVRFADGTALPNSDMPAAFMLPGAKEEGAYLVYHNFHVLLKWNFSRFFGTAVGLLADEIAKG